MQEKTPSKVPVQRKRIRPAGIYEVPCFTAHALGTWTAVSFRFYLYL